MEASQLPPCPGLQFSLLTSHFNCCSNFLTGLPRPAVGPSPCSPPCNQRVLLEGGGEKGYLGISQPPSLSTASHCIRMESQVFFVSQVLQDFVPFFPDLQPHWLSFSSYNTFALLQEDSFHATPSVWKPPAHLTVPNSRLGSQFKHTQENLPWPFFLGLICLCVLSLQDPCNFLIRKLTRALHFYLQSLD